MYCNPLRHGRPFRHIQNASAKGTEAEGRAGQEGGKAWEAESGGKALFGCKRGPGAGKGQAHMPKGAPAASLQGTHTLVSQTRGQCMPKKEKLDYTGGPPLCNKL
ncbi:hypothetical protein V8E52_001913 [Russula decolorans]